MSSSFLNSKASKCIGKLFIDSDVWRDRCNSVYCISVLDFHIGRIEFSCLVWRAVPRLKVYVMTFVCLCAAASFAFLGEGRKMEFLILWSILFFSGLFIFNNSFVLIKRLIRFEYAKLQL